MTFHPQFYKNFYKIDKQQLILAAQGGLTIALAASLYYSFYGFILGISGLVGNILKGKFDEDFRKSITIISGLIFSSAIVYFMDLKELTDFYPFDQKVTGSNLSLIVSGLLVGLGTQLASGCTSGHGLCGLPRLSIRSIAAVMIFLTTGLMTATFDIPRLLPKISQLEKFKLPENYEPLYYIIGAVLIPLILLIISFSNKFKRSFKKSISTVVFFFIGIIFGFGLMLAGMSKREKIYGFLELNKKWDPSLFVVLMTGVGVNLIIFTIMKKGVGKPILGEKLIDTRGQIDGKLIIGSLLFGLGWGIGGLCPGPFLLLLTLKNLRIPFFWGLSFIFGMKFSQIINPSKPKVQEPAPIKEPQELKKKSS